MFSLKSFVIATASLTILPFANAGIVKRNQEPDQPSCVDFTPFTYAGCFRSPPGQAFDTLLFTGTLDKSNMTIEKCVAYCKGNDYRYAGIEYYGKCTCGASVNGFAVDESICNYKCTGNKGEVCGGDNAVSIYQDPTFPVVDNSVITDYAAIGCYTEGTGKRSLAWPQDQVTADTLTPASCLTACKQGGFPIAGVEYGRECYCGVVLGNGTVSAPQTECNVACAGDKTQSCGGPSRLNIFVANDLESLEPCKDASSSSSTVYSTTTTSAPSSSPTLSTVLTTPTSSSSNTVSTSSSSSFLTSTTAATSDTYTSTPSPTSDASSVSSTTSSVTSVSSSSSYSISTSSTSTSSIYSSSASTKSTSSSLTSVLTTSTPCSSVFTTLSSSTTAKPSTFTTTSKPTTSPILTTSKPTTPSTSSTKTTASLCTKTTTITPTATCEYKCGSWCSNPIPQWSDQSSCFKAQANCAVQIASCFLEAGWPGSLKCFDFANWCQSVSSHCNGSCPGKSCSKPSCTSKYPPSGPTIPGASVSTSVYTCPVSSTKTASKTTLSTGKVSSTSTCVPIPTQTNICVQPHNPNNGYSSTSPVGNIPLPCLTCNNAHGDYNNGNCFKLYTSPQSSNCPSYPRGGTTGPSKACKDACDHQYTICIGTYAQGCKGRSGPQFGDSYSVASNKCTNQRADCYKANANISPPKSRCGSWNTGWY